MELIFLGGPASSSYISENSKLRLKSKKSSNRRARYGELARQNIKY
jgi:hypothetical protein